MGRVFSDPAEGQSKCPVAWLDLRLINISHSESTGKTTQALVGLSVVVSHKKSAGTSHNVPGKANSPHLLSRLRCAFWEMLLQSV